MFWTLLPDWPSKKIQTDSHFLQKSIVQLSGVAFRKETHTWQFCWTTLTPIVINARFILLLIWVTCIAQGWQKKIYKLTQIALPFELNLKDGCHLGFLDGQSGRFDKYSKEKHNTKLGVCITICTDFLLFYYKNGFLLWHHESHNNPSPSLGKYFKQAAWCILWKRHHNIHVYDSYIAGPTI